MMVFLPTDAATLQAWRGGVAVEGDGFAPTPAMLAAHEFGPRELEDAEYVALGYASVASLLGVDGPTSRWVASLEVADPAPGEAADFGAVRVTGARWAALTAYFVDEPEASDAVGRVATAIAGRELTDALTDDAVLEFVAEHDLLWHLPSELGS